MDTKQFFTQLAIISGATTAVLLLLHVGAPMFQPHLQFGLFNVFLFALICTGLYFAGRSTARSRTKVAFNNIISLSVFGKMALALGVLLLYKSLANPINQWYVATFLLIYTVFTIFEVVFMTKLARS